MKFFAALLILFTTFLACKKASLYKNTTSDTQIAKVESTTKDWFIADTENSNSIAFIAGFDEDDNTYYANAAAYFKKQHITVINELHSLEDIITYLNKSKKYFSQIHIISHSNPWAGMSLKTRNDGERITVHNLKKALKSQSIPSLKSGVTTATSIIFHSCGLGENLPLVKLLKQAFTSGASPQIIASPYFNVFGGDYVPHYLAKPYYVAYPTAHSPGPLALSQEIALKYPTVSLDWKTALTTRTETTPTSIYSYRFNVPVEWIFSFSDVSEMPKLETRDNIMDFVSEQDEMALAIYELGIPLEKFRWIIKISEEKKTFTIKGKTTVLCVLEPIENSTDPGNYAEPQISNKNLYTVF